jgi:hypothetical protein
MLLSRILASALFVVCALMGTAQSVKPIEKCDGECCKEGKHPDKSSLKAKNVVSMETATKKKVIACKLTSSELRKRKEEVIASLKSKILDKQELKQGYKYKFSGTDQVIDEIVTFVKTERLCCDFFVFDLTLIDDNLWLSITGPEGAKDFIKAELDL